MGAEFVSPINPFLLLFVNVLPQAFINVKLLSPGAPPRFGSSIGAVLSAFNILLFAYSLNPLPFNSSNNINSLNDEL
ncbi:hypothetical protein [Paraclostridium ghonii]|uniref:hypothetical protein n=1 Tax=Paraclostridium ghonii TaxID=29358 RepID=UPI003A5C00A7